MAELYTFSLHEKSTGVCHGNLEHISWKAFCWKKNRDNFFQCHKIWKKPLEVRSSNPWGETYRKILKISDLGQVRPKRDPNKQNVQLCPENALPHLEFSYSRCQANVKRIPKGHCFWIMTISKNLSSVADKKSWIYLFLFPRQVCIAYA